MTTKEELTSPDLITIQLQQLLELHKDKRIAVVGTTCAGKSTFLHHIPQARDMDELVFPLLSQEENSFVCHYPWTEEIGKTMTRLTKERVHIIPGQPVFGTIVLDSDLIIYLQISDNLLHERTNLRKAHFEDAKNMQRQIETEITNSGIPKIDFNVG